MQPSTTKPRQTQPSCSLYVILAADGRSAVVFRRGPSKRVMIARWWLKDDRVEYGHWFAGRLYERFSDLSPDGNLLLYFAARYKGQPPTWTAISRTPYLTALVMWTCYVNGGGIFETNRSILLDNFVSSEPLISRNRTLHPFPEEELWHHITTRHATERDDLRRHYCVEHKRLVRDGWRCVQDGVQMVEWRYGGKIPRLVEPQIYERPMPKLRGRTGAPILRRVLRRVGEIKTQETFEILSQEGASLRTMEGSTWADWHAKGDLLFARDGCLYRLKSSLAKTRTEVPMEGVRLVHDFRSLGFDKVKPPVWATRWSG